MTIQIIQPNDLSDRDFEIINVDGTQKVALKPQPELKIGGRNLLLKSHVGRNTLGTTTYAISPNVELSTIRELVLSVDVDVENFVATAGKYPRIGAEVQVFYNEAGTDYSWFGVWLTATSTPQTTKQRIFGKFIIPDGKTIAKLTYNKTQINSARFDRAEVKNVKLEVGNVATGWSPAPDDFDTRITGADNRTSGNLIPNSDFAFGFDGWSMRNWDRISGLTCGFNLSDDTGKYNLPHEKVFWVKDNRRTTAAYTQTLAQNNGNRFAVRAGDLLQCSALVAGINFQEAAVIYMDFYNAAGKYLGGGLNRVQINEFAPYDKNLANLLDGKQTAGDTTTLDRFHICYSNAEVPPNAAWCIVSIRFRFLPNAEGLGLFARPQVCVIGHLEQGYVPYQVGVFGLGEKIADLQSRIVALETRQANQANGIYGN